MMPQTLPDDAKVEVVVEDEKGTKVTLTGALQDATAAEQTKNKWEAGKTYTYTINLSGVTAEITFFKGKNYTAHNISANGDPFTVDFNYPQTVSEIKLRFAYVNQDGSFEEIKADGNPDTSYNPNYYDLTGKKTSVTLRSPVMNNYGIVACAKSDETDFVVQMQVKAILKTDMPVDPDNPDVKCEYLPGTDDGTWYTLWKGKMYPPNYIYNRDIHGNVNSNIYVLMSRKDIGSYNQIVARQMAAGYFEVDENHPYLGKGKWGLPWPFWDANALQRALGLLGMMDNNTPPGNNPIYGDKPLRQDYYWTGGEYTTNIGWGLRGINVGRQYFSFDMSDIVSNAYTGKIQLGAFNSALYSLGVRTEMYNNYYQ